MPKRKGVPIIRKTIQVPYALLERLDRAVAEQRVVCTSFSGLIVSLLSTFLERDKED